jgi:hypothetical protein
VAVTEVMIDPHRVDIEEQREERPLSRGGSCLVCGDWIEPDAPNVYRVLVSQPPREAEYACHEACFDRVRHPSVRAPT